MAETPKSLVEIIDFPGLMEDQDPYDFEPGGSSIQVNACCIAAGQLDIRHGSRQVTFET
jgi:hypothetical protein